MFYRRVVLNGKYFQVLKLTNESLKYPVYASGQIKIKCTLLSTYMRTWGGSYDL